MTSRAVARQYALALFDVAQKGGQTDRIGREIAEFAARAGETYTIRVNRFSGTDDVWFGVAWRTTGVDLVVDRFEQFGSLAIEG